MMHQEKESEIMSLVKNFKTKEDVNLILKELTDSESSSFIKETLPGLILDKVLGQEDLTELCAYLCTSMINTHAILVEMTFSYVQMFTNKERYASKYHRLLMFLTKIYLVYKVKIYRLPSQMPTPIVKFVKIIIDVSKMILKQKPIEPDAMRCVLVSMARLSPDLREVGSVALQILHSCAANAFRNSSSSPSTKNTLMQLIDLLRGILDELSYNY